MAEPTKKFSFGFTKTTKKPNLSNKLRNEERSDKQLIDCLEGKTIRVKGRVEKVEEKPLIIPVQPSSKRVLVKTENGDINLPALPQNLPKGNVGESITIKQEPLDPEEPNQLPGHPDKITVQIKTEPPEPEGGTLEEIAAREILREAEESQKQEGNGILMLPAALNSDTLAKASTEEDYESIPVSAFGSAALKGMGWQEDVGIGNKPQVVATVEATGAKRLSSAVEQKMRAAKMGPNSAGNAEQEELELVKGAFVKVLSGAMKGEYGEVEGLNVECARVMVKMVLRGGIVSFIESALQVVTKSDFVKNSRVLNSSKYEEVKNKVSKSLEESSKPSPKRSRSSDSSPEETRSSSPVKRRSTSPQKRKVSHETRQERRGNRDRSNSRDGRYNSSRKRSRSPSPDRNRNKSDSYQDRRYSRRDSPRKIASPRRRTSPSPVRDSKRKNYEESAKRSKVDYDRYRSSKGDSYSRRRSDSSRSLSPEKSRQTEKSRREPSSDSNCDTPKKVKKSSKKKHKKRSSSVSSSASEAASPKMSSSHKKKKKKSHKKKSKRRDSSSSPERRKKSHKK